MKRPPNNYPITEDMQRQLDALGDDEPDTSDIPEIPAEAWKNAYRGPGQFFKPRKEPVSVRIDMDVVDWLKNKSAGYQTEINAILRREMEADRAK